MIEDRALTELNINRLCECTGIDRELVRQNWHVQRFVKYSLNCRCSISDLNAVLFDDPYPQSPTGKIWRRMCNELYIMNLYGDSLSSMIGMFSQGDTVNMFGNSVVEQLRVFAKLLSDVLHEEGMLEDQGLCLSSLQGVFEVIQPQLILFGIMNRDVIQNRDVLTVFEDICLGGEEGEKSEKSFGFSQEARDHVNSLLLGSMLVPANNDVVASIN